VAGGGWPDLRLAWPSQVGAANVVGSLFFCFPTMGSVGATSMLDAFGGRSGLANALSAATVRARLTTHALV
jgi:MFS superfamily sulfate permease-like transporter